MELDEAQLVAIFLESLMFGVFVPVYISAMWILVHRAHSTLNIALIGTSTVTFLLGVAHLALDLRRILVAFVGFKNVEGGAIAFYELISDPTEVTKTVIYVLQTITADSFLVFRCYVVWGRNWFIVAFPLFLVLASGVAGFGASYQFTLVAPGKSIFLSNLVPWVTSFFVITLATNLLCTTLIAYKIYNTRRRAARSNAQLHGGVYKAMTIIVESGAVYSAALLTLLTLYLSGSNGQYPALDLINPLIGLVFNLILVRMGLGLSNDSSQQHPSMHNVARGPTGLSSSDRYPMNTVSINVAVTRSVEGPDSGSDYDLEGQKRAVSSHAF